MSHLLQMRGLKLDQGVKYKQVGIVASFTDAWIETDKRIAQIEYDYVASFTDAWIETGA